MSSEEYDSDCDSVTETEGSGDEVEVVQPSSETVTTAPRSSKENDKFKPARNTRGRRLRAAAKERSRVWAHYTRYDEPIMGIVDGKEQQIGIEKRAQCKYCPTTLKCDSRANGTSSLAKHTETVCKGYPGKVDLETQHTMNADVLDPNGNVVVRKWSEDACLDAACVMIVLDELPFSSIERPGFKHFCRVAVPNWIPPCRKVVVKNFLRMYDTKKEELRKELRSHSVCLTTDTWTSCQNINYMVITAHFIDGGWNMHKRVLNFCVIPNHSGNSIGKILETCMMEWNLDKVLTISVDNASANKVAIEYLIEKMSGWPRQPIFGGKYMHVRCLAHILNLIVKSGLHIMNKSVASIRNAVRYVRSSGQRLEAFKACVEKEKIPCKKVCVLDVPTRWNSTYMMLDTALQLKKAFNRMADEEDGRYRSYFDEDEELNDEGEEAESQVVVATQQQKKRVGPPVVSDWEKASVLVKYLKVYLDTTVDVSAQLKPTAHKAFVDIAIVKAELDEMFNKPLSSDASETDKVLHGMANKMRAKFRKYFGSVDDINQLFFIALVLDPRYKLKNVEHVCHTMLNMRSDAIRRKSDEVKQLLLELCDLYATLEGEKAESSQSSAAKRKRSVGEGSSNTPTPSVQPEGVLGKRAAMLKAWNKQLEAEAVIVGGEVDRYLLDPIEKPKDREKWSILDWWRCNGSKYPNLQAVARDVLAIQVSTVASESSFSTGKRVIDPHRSSLTPRTVEALICLQNWLKSDAIMGLQYIPSIEEMGWFEDVEKGI